VSIGLFDLHTTNGQSHSIFGRQFVGKSNILMNCLFFLKSCDLLTTFPVLLSEMILSRHFGEICSAKTIFL